MIVLFFLFKLALRVGNEKDEDEADTVGCCSLRVEHIKLFDKFDGIGENIVEFDFLGKDSIRYKKNKRKTIFFIVYLFLLFYHK